MHNALYYRSEYNQKSRHLQEQLSDLRGEIDSLKVDDRQTELDRIHAEHVSAGDDKYSTLRKVSPFTLFSFFTFFDPLTPSYFSYPIDLSTYLARSRRRSNGDSQSGLSCVIVCTWPSLVFISMLHYLLQYIYFTIDSDRFDWWLLRVFLAEWRRFCEIADSTIRRPLTLPNAILPLPTPSIFLSVVQCDA